MAGQTLWEIMKKRLVRDKAVEEQFYNPLEARIGDTFTVNTLDFGRHLLRLQEIHVWDRDYGGQNHPMADYLLANDEAQCLLTVVPSAELDVGHQVLLMTQYYPDTPGPLGWSEDSANVLQFASESDRFIRYEGEEREETYFRSPGVVFAPCRLSVIRDVNRDGKVELDEVDKRSATLWSFARTTQDEANQKFIQYLQLRLDGTYCPDRKGDPVSDGDATLIMYRGEEILASKIMKF
jgi:hypothetical protein